MKILTETYQEQITGVIGCFDRLVIFGTLPVICYAQGMTSYLYSNHIKIFDYAKFVEPLRNEIRSNTERVAKDAGVQIEYVKNKNIRKEDLVQQIIKKRGLKPGLVHILSAMERCSTYTPWHNKSTGKTYLKSSTAQCIHYYFYFIDKYLGLCYLRVPTWCPFRLQLYCNGHNILARELDNERISYTMLDNAFDSISDFKKAQELSNNLNIRRMHRLLDTYAATFCPVHKHFNQMYHWSISQAEYATDIIFKKQQNLKSIYEDLITTAIHTVKPENIITFLGKKLDPRYKGEVGNNYYIRILGSRIKHTMGKNSIKMYDKFSKILRIETTTNDITFFKHYREVEHKNGTKTNEVAKLRKYIYSLNQLNTLLSACNRRYIEFISAIENKQIGRKRLNKICTTKKENNRNYKGFNFFNQTDTLFITTIMKGQFNISGFRNLNIRNLLPFLSSGQISRLLKRLKIHGLIKKVNKSYKYYVTKLGKETVLTAEKLKEFVVIPALNY